MILIIYVNIENSKYEGAIKMEKHFGLLGFPIKHSLSPFIHHELFKIKHFKATYSLFNVKEKNLADFLKKIDKLDCFNVIM